MNDNLQDAIAGLAEQFGVTTGQLWDWAQGNGIEAYARVEIAQSACIAALSLIFTVAVWAVVYKLAKLAKDSPRKYEDVAEVAVLAAIFITIGAMLFFTFSMVNLSGWLASPEGMVIQQLVGAIGE